MTNITHQVKRQIYSHTWTVFVNCPDTGCIMRGVHTVIPPTLCNYVLLNVHQGHMGIVKMKELARNSVWWPGIDWDIENLARSYQSCNEVQNAPPAEIHSWMHTDKPWQWIHIDFAGPVQNMNFLIVVDTYSKWSEVIPMTSTTSTSTIEASRDMFARWRLPSHLVSDNGLQFTSSEFALFFKMQWDQAQHHSSISPIQ